MEFVGSGRSILDFNSLPSPVDKYELLQVIGEGTYGEVHLAVELNSQNERLVAIKILENLIANIGEAEQEYLVLKELSIHPNLPFFHGLYYNASLRPENSQLWFVMEHCSGGSVTDLVQGLKKYENRHLTEIQLAYILHEVIDALLHLHQNKVIHRDVKGHNILLTENGRVKLIDFGVAANLTTTMEKRNTSVGTPFWMPPEVIACERQGDITYDARSDVWSLGVTAIELAEGEPPLADLHPMRALFQIPRNPPPTLTKPGDWSHRFNEFIGDCLIKNIEMRPWMSELRKETFITQIGVTTDGIRQSITKELQLVKSLGPVRREPEVTTKHGKLKNDRKNALQTMFVDDLASLATNDEETILEQLYQRFEQKSIYTYIGDIFLVVNPYENLGIYSDFYQFKYRGSSIADVSPHIFGVADQAYHTMLHRKKIQALVISGESGSGKTETANHLLRQLVYLGKAPNRNLEMKLLQVNPILEAFGNASTISNRNSSRFVKFLNTTFSRTGKITGAEIYTYLLEDSRVVTRNQNETNFHIFSYVLQGMAAEDGFSENLSKIFKQSYKYLPNDHHKLAVDPVKKFGELQRGFHLLGFNPEEEFNIYEILIAILHLGEIQFGSDDNGSEGCGVLNGDELKIVATLLGVSAGDLGIALTTRNAKCSGEACIRRNNVEEAIEIRDSLARTLYNRLFQWIVYQINALFSISCIAYGSSLAIGILDIFGFYSSTTNSLEQLIINSTNEYLQYHFNTHIFAWGQQEYMVEGINVELIKYADTKSILDLLLGNQNGIFAIMEQEASSKTGDDENLKDKLNLSCGSQKYYRRSRDLGFEIRHYVARTRYNLKDFVKKNRGLSSPDVTELLRCSSNDAIRTILRCVLTKAGNLGAVNRKESLMNSEKAKLLEENSTPILASQFRYSMVELISKLLAAQPHFIRCIKPNNHNMPNSFDLLKVLQQLRYSGLMDCIQIRQTGYSHRFTFVDFLKSYCFLGFSFDERVVADRESCQCLLLRLNLDGWVLGKTKVFLKYYHVEYLEKLCEEEIRKIIFVQACVRRWLTRIRLSKGMWVVAKQVVSIQKAAKVWRKQTAKDSYEKSSNKKRSSWLRIQVLGIKDDIDCIDDEKNAEEKAAILIQSHFRGFMVRKKWGPILEDRIKEIVSTTTNKETAKEALKAEGLDEEEAAQVLQRYYRKWKVAKQNSIESHDQGQLQEETPQKQAIVSTVDWDAPFRLVEIRRRERRRGKKRGTTTLVDIMAHRREMIQQGLVSQKFKNEQRDARVARNWNDIISTATDSNSKESKAPERKLSKFGKNLLSQALEQRIYDLRHVGSKPSSALLQPSSLQEKKSVKIGERNVRVRSFEVDPNKGDVDFRKLLRKTGNGVKDFQN